MKDVIKRMEQRVQEDSHWKKRFQEESAKKVYIANNGHIVQMVRTPESLCKEIVGKLTEYVELKDKTILVMNIEFLPFVQDAKTVYFYADNKEKRDYVEIFYQNVKILDGNFLEWKMSTGSIDMKFDVVVGNPPYQAPTDNINKSGSGAKGSRNTIWQHFVIKSIDICKDGGWVCLVHPARWRKPDDITGELLKNKDIKYLEIHSKYDGLSTFGVMTNYDWYILRNVNNTGNTIIKDQKGNQHTIDTSKWIFIPNFEFNLLKTILAKEGENKCEVIQSYSAYDSRKDYVSSIQTKEFRYPCVHSTMKDSIRYIYSSTNKKGHFGTPKVIFGDNGGDTGIFNAVVDFDGIFGMTNHAIGIVITSKKEGENIKTALESEKFKLLINSCQYGGFQIDYRMFKYFRKDFWKEFI